MVRGNELSVGRGYGATYRIADRPYFDRNKKKKKKKPEKEVELSECRFCISWLGPGINVDHAHCSDPRSSHKTTSKNGDKDYDSCVYWRDNALKGEKNNEMP